MEVKTIYVNYDIKRMRPPNLIAFTHENDKNTQVIELHLTDGDEPMTLAADYTYTAAIVNSDTKALINDSIDCELNEGGNVLIPIDNLHVRGRQSLKIELTVTDEQGEQVLSLPFPIWFKVSGSILDGAEVTPESEGTVPELLEEAKEALENAGDYESLENKPQINGHELVGNKTGEELGLQQKLTAGENITINANGEISATGGTDDYNELINKPSINGSPVSGHMAANMLGLASAHYLTNREIEDGFINTYKVDNTTMYLGYINFTNLPEGSALTERGQVWCYGVYEYEGYARDEYVEYGFSTKGKLYCRTGEKRWPRTDIEWNDWIEFNQIISSATVNQNGTITFTMSDGSTVTTTGESVIGPQGPAGADGNDYVLTNQDKSDIADLVLAQLPTTQEVLYGNESD